MSENLSSPRKRQGRWLLVSFLAALAVASAAASRLGYVDRARDRLYGRAPRLSPGDFPAGVMAPIDDVVRIPTRALIIGVVPRGSTSALLWAAGDAERVGLFRAGYAIDVKVQRFAREEELRKALIRGGENGGVDLAAMPVSSMAMSASLLHDASPRVVMLLGRSRGQEVVVGRGITTLQGLAGKRIGVEDRGSAWYLLLWSLSRVGLSLRDVKVVPLDGAYAAGAALKTGEVDAVAGLLGDVDPAAREVGAQQLTSTADAPHLLATVLVTRGDFAARYPDAIRRVIRGVLDANTQVLKDSSEAARVLGSLAPQLGDPTEAIGAAPPATLKENLAFFGIADEAPVTYAELFKSATELNQKLFGAPPAPEPEDTADLGALKYVATPQTP
ncbi:MAG: ABC transporter substrate-binding protein [Archangium sp.]|nr:ABC transporter substrate-binding protein [Archangium sp.]MDP3157333.1 ABC transporter substrate-binding protein [Archangium sp.]MDP3571171.1 ABC transporter substrate-binding protein [Archangium sp.]